MRVRFVHAADLHLDRPFSGLRDLDETIGAALRDATLTAFDRVVEICLQEAVDFALFAGDLFDGEHRSLRAQFHLVKGLERLQAAGIRGFLVHGNHDPLEDWSPRLRWPESAHRFPADEVTRQSVKRDGETVCEVYGISFRTSQEKRNLARLFERRDSAPFAVGLLHAEVGGREGQSLYAPCSLEDLRAVGVDYWALGHIHTRRVFQPADPCIVYAGNVQGLDPNETEPRGCYVVTLATGRAPELEFRATSPAEWRHLETPIDELEDVQGLIDRAVEQIEAAADETAADLVLLRLFLTGVGPLHHELSYPEPREELLQTLREAVEHNSPPAWIESLQNQTRPLVGPADLARRNEFIREFQRLAEAAPDDEATLAQLRGEEELAALLRQPELRRVREVTDSDVRGWLVAAGELVVERLAGGGGA